MAPPGASCTRETDRSREVPIAAMIEPLQAGVSRAADQRIGEHAACLQATVAHDSKWFDHLARGRGSTLLRLRRRAFYRLNGVVYPLHGWGVSASVPANGGFGGAWSRGAGLAGRRMGPRRPRARPGWAQADAIVARLVTPAFPNRTFDITRYGAKADGRTNATAALRSAIAACAKAGGGRVLVPEGRFPDRRDPPGERRESPPR